jgi:hypothetical protein
MRFSWTASLLTVAFAGCSSSSPDAANGSPDASSPEGGSPFQHDLVVSMELTVAAGQELHQCQFVTLPTDTEVNVIRFAHRYSAGSHHFLVFATDLDAIPADLQGHYDCTNGNEPIMQHARGVLYGGQTPEGESSLPDGVHFPMKAHQVLMLQAHYINTSREDIHAKVQAGFDVGPAGAAGVEAGFLIFYDPFIYVPPKATASSGIRCPGPKEDVTLIQAFTHYHQRGTGMRAWLDPDVATRSDVPFYETSDWEHPNNFSGPFKIPAGSYLRTRCDYVNPEAVEVIQGPNAATSEMCVLAGLYYPKQTREFENCFNLSVEGTGTEACGALIPCVQACPGGEAPEYTNGGVNVGPCWEKCVATGCPQATDRLLALFTCVSNNCQIECNTGSCEVCAASKCADTLSACSTHVCAP